MNCEACGRALTPGDKFCPQCGSDLSAQPGAKAAAAPVYVPQPAARREEPVTRGERWLLPGVIGLGVVFQFFVLCGHRTAAETFTWYAAFWLTYVTLFHAVCWKKALARPLGFLVCGVAVLLCVMVLFQSRGYSDPALAWLNFLAIPCVLMLHAQYVTRPLPREHESGYLGLFFEGFLVQPFQHAGRFFRSMGALFAGKEKGKAALLGVLIAVPVLFVVLSLLLSADAVLHAWSETLLRNFDLDMFVWRILLAAVCAVLFYSFLYGAGWSKAREYRIKEYPLWNAVPFDIVLAALSAVYAVFTAVQFVYLFGGRGLPAGLTYSQYAVQGFNQLIWVAAINFTALSLCLCRAKRTKPLDALMLLLLLMTVVILVSAFTRLMLYIGAYGLTFRRVQAFWFLCYLSAVLVLYGVRLYVPRLPLLRASTLLFLLWYAALNIPNLAGWYAAGGIG